MKSKHFSHSMEELRPTFPTLMNVYSYSNVCRIVSRYTCRKSVERSRSYSERPNVSWLQWCKSEHLPLSADIIAYQSSFSPQKTSQNLFICKNKINLYTSFCGSHYHFVKGTMRPLNAVELKTESMAHH